jgi:hypothetical protein
MEIQKQLVIRSVLDAWHSRLESANKIFSSLTDEDLQKEVSPGRNRALYLLGHLAAVHDRMLPLLNFEPQLYPSLEEIFLNKPDRAVSEIPSAKELRSAWETVNSKLAGHFNSLPADGWFEKHTAVSDEDFVKEPHRNRLNVLVGRTNHLQYHMGQVALIRK